MFLKNNVVVFLLMCFLFSSSRNIFTPKEELIIPKIALQENRTTKPFILEKNLDKLNYNDTIVIKKNDNIYYYKVIKKSFGKKIGAQNETDLVLYDTQNQVTIVAKNTGKMIKSANFM